MVLFDGVAVEELAGGATAGDFSEGDESAAVAAAVEAFFAAELAMGVPAAAVRASCCCFSKASLSFWERGRILLQLPVQLGSHDVQARLAILQAHVDILAHLFRGPHEQHGSIRAAVLLLPHLGFFVGGWAAVVEAVVD